MQIIIKEDHLSLFVKHLKEEIASMELKIQQTGMESP